MIYRKTAFDIQKVNFSKVEDVIDSAARILDRANELKLFLSETSRQSRDAARLISEAKRWADKVKTHINLYSAAEALALTDIIDLMHRIAYQQPADRALINGIIFKAFDARIHGEKTVDEYMLYRAIRAGIARKDKAFLDRPMQWLCLCNKCWYDEAVKGYGQSGLSSYDIISRATILMEADLLAYEGRNQTAFKRRLYDSTRRYIDNYDAAERKACYAVRQYRTSSAAFMN